MLSLRRPYLLFVGDARDRLAAKTGIGLLHWRPQFCLGQVKLPGCAADLDSPTMTVEEGAQAGAATLVIGVANAGGVIPSSWRDSLIGAARAGLDIANGLHQPLRSVPGLAEAAEAAGVRLIEARAQSRDYPVGTGEPRPGRRLLTVGTDCSVGKMYTALAIEREMRSRGMKADFRATGQTGILIAGEGVSIDAVVADFIAGAVETLSPAAEDDHWDIIEGQGSLFHPSYAGVSLGLLHGAQPDALVMCHEPTRTHMRGLPGRALPDLAACVAANEAAARLTNPRARCVGVAVNASGLPAGERAPLLERLAAQLGLPCVDPMTDGAGALVDRLAG